MRYWHLLLASNWQFTISEKNIGAPKIKKSYGAKLLIFPIFWLTVQDNMIIHICALIIFQGSLYSSLPSNHREPDDEVNQIQNIYYL